MCYPFAQGVTRTVDIVSSTATRGQLRILRVNKEWLLTSSVKYLGSIPQRVEEPVSQADIKPRGDARLPSKPDAGLPPIRGGRRMGELGSGAHNWWAVSRWSMLEEVQSIASVIGIVSWKIVVFCSAAFDGEQPDGGRRC